MKKVKSNNVETEIDSIRHLLLAIRKDPLMNKKVTRLLKLDTYPRRLVLNTWLEQLRLNNAPGKLTKALSILFDENIAQKALKLISR